ncbi:cytochrome P450 [Saccharopolyspora sp. K220]|uniref:cytochrome P450 n=1 Tax=Saccharopolyspora soli TaxID=2926618 RepID=UPI001F579B02|nr:cytochrome P450 [Saccharopolyspora soli]MCI2416136.1 cytochrome P450 [Saccharopolyspora soli]
MAQLSMEQIYAEESIADPYPLYRRIREADPVYWDERMGDDGGWMVTGYEAAVTALMDPQLSAARPQWLAERLPADADASQTTAMQALHQQIVTSDPPKHNRIRRELKAPFMPRPVDDMQEQVTKAAHRLLDGALADGGGEFDLMATFGYPLPALSIGGMLGVPGGENQDYLHWMLCLGLLIDDGPASRQHQAKLLGGVHEFVEFFRGLVSQRRGDRRDDLLQALADSYTGGHWASEEELLGNLAFLLTAGQISTAHQIGNSVLHLLREPDLYEQVRADPAMVSNMSAELMRFDSSVQLTKRRVVEPFELGGHELAPGAELFVWIGAAHRDPDQYPDPDRIDPERGEIPHIAFGRGIHFCLGARLGKVVHDLAVQAFVERVPQPSLAAPDAVDRSIMPTFRGPFRLPVRYR